MKKKLLSLIIFSIAFSLQGQVSLKSVEEDYYDFLSIQGLTERPFLNYRTLSDNKWDLSNAENSDLHLWKDNKLESSLSFFDSRLSLKIFGPDWFNSFNTTTPYGQNDGALWQGRGYNTSLTAGVSAEAFGLNLTFKPQITFSQNLDFEIMKSVYESEFGYFWGGFIDFPQRFGDKAFFTFDFGDTEIRYTWKSFTLGFGTEQIWLGPAHLNPMLHSNNGPSYPKFDIGLRKKKLIIPWFGWDAGEVEGRIIYGQLTESDYFDSNPSNNKRFNSSIFASYAPSFLQGLTIGFNKICISPWGKNSWKYLNPFFNSNTIGEGKDKGEDQKMSISVDWLFPNAGFEAFYELGLDDFSSEPLTNPFHTAIYTVGIKKTVDFKSPEDLKGELILEFNNFEMSQDFQLQWNYMGYYAHGGISQGYTQKGQIIGAGSGYFGNSQLIKFVLYYPKGFSSIFVHRNCPEVNFIYNKAVNTDASDDSHTNTISKDFYAIYKTQLCAGINSGYWLTKNFLLNGELDFIYIRFPFFKASSEKFNGNDDISFRFCCGVKYNF